MSANGKYAIGVSSEFHAFGHAIVEVSDPGKIIKQQIVLTAGKSVKGKALCNDGEPPAGWMTFALPTWWNFGGHPSGVKIDEDGSFGIPHVDDDQYNLSISIPSGNRTLKRSK